VRNSATLLLALALTCTKPVATTPAAPAEPPYSGPMVVLPDGFGVKVELATNDETRAQGLMFRDHVPAGTGMLFLFPKNGDYPFWMKNTLIPLDMVWIDEGRRVVHVKANVPPCKADPCPSYPPEVEARYVLELGAGEAAKHRVVPGTTLKYERIDNVAVH
jgi:uncharacterized membrane protein (UPF0127 family)